MKNIILCFLFIFSFSTISIKAQEKFTLNGTISEEKSNESLIGVSIYFPELQTGTTTNEYGFYSITLPKGTYKIIISYLGFNTIVESIIFSENITKNFNLTDALENLDEIVITQNVENLNIQAPQMSVNRLTSGTIKDIPVVLGESDIIKAITLLPGVTNAGEGSSGFNVRCCSAYQNLIL